MDIFRDCCAGLDAHKKTVVACVRRARFGGEVGASTRTFGTMTADLLELADWLKEQGVGQVAMESTGVYLKLIWHMLEDSSDLVLVNATHVKQVPGRETDVKDAGWIA
jgi:transposase